MRVAAQRKTKKKGEVGNFVPSSNSESKLAKYVGRPNSKIG